MSLAHAILGILQRQPMTGYNLKTQCFDTSIAHFWSADQAQIYRTLDKLSDDGMVESYTEIQEDRPNRKVYSITESGRAELRRWMETSLPLPVHREAFLVQLFFAENLPKEKMLELVEGQIAAHQQRLDRYREVALPELDADVPPEFKQGRLTLELGIQLEQTYLEWLQTVKQVVGTF